MTKRKRAESEPELSPIEAEMAESAAPEASADEVAAASIFTEPAEVESAAAGEAEPAVAQAPAERAALEAELADLRAKVDEYLDGWRRTQAEFANYKKRIDREQDEARSRAMASVLTRILPVVDDLERAVRERPDLDEVRGWAEGIELIHRKLAAMLEAEGVEVIPAEGAFDPALHEAVTHEPSDDHQEGQIIEVIQQGYRLGERVLRPARVRVAK